MSCLERVWLAWRGKEGRDTEICQRKQGGKEFIKREPRARFELLRSCLFLVQGKVIPTFQDFISINLTFIFFWWLYEKKNNKMTTTTSSLLYGMASIGSHAKGKRQIECIFVPDSQYSLTHLLSKELHDVCLANKLHLHRTWFSSLTSMILQPVSSVAAHQRLEVFKHNRPPRGLLQPFPNLVF